LREASIRPTGLGRTGRAAIALLAGVLALTLLAPAADAAKGKGKKKGERVTVMTRNLYLGADLGPALAAGTPAGFVSANGGILRQVDATNFPVRAKALAAEIKQRDPDLVGLQEVASWRTAPASFAPIANGPSATTVRYDFLQLLVDELNKGKCAKPKKGKGKKASSSKSNASCDRYSVAVVKNEFDFEAPADLDNDPSTGAATLGGEINGRLTMRDAILVRGKSGVKTSKPISGTFPTLLRVVAGGAVEIDVTRGWTALDARVRGSKPFRFVNLHHEAFDSSASNNTNQGTTVGQGQVREAQAKSLVAAGGPANTKLPVILLGDLNSDDDTVGADGDVLAYNALVAAGFRPVDTSNPLSCCLNDPNLVGGSLADFDHHIDHVMTDNKAIRFRRGFVTGRAPVNGLWPSDHNGVTSELTVPRKGKKGKKGKKK
jgi:endonuclease/exonuclease/phosphatase family metal-dependent hydrolase